MIDVRGLSFTYPKSKAPAVRNLDFSIEEGEIFGLLGPNGAGKSTTQKILIKLLKDYQGDVSVFGKNLGRWGSEYFEQVGVSFEFPNLFLKLTATENLRYYGALYSSETEDPAALLDRVGLADAGGLLVSQFSKGMKTRLNVARALLHKPALIFMDEPTAGLDPVSARNIKELIRSYGESGSSILLTTHDMTLADEVCDRVALIVDGTISTIETPRELKLKHGSRSLRVEFSSNGALETKEFDLDGLADNSEFNSLLRDREIQTIHTMEATLEDVFVQVTGRSLS
jgi:fluoroquinolone transport system ATP-binding protein